MAADLTTGHGVGAAVHGTGALIHCASYTGPDPAIAWRVNFQSTRELVTAAGRQGITNIVYVSTAAVYAPGRKQGADERHPVAPSSEVSRSRRAAEEVVLDAGGSVIRPHLLYGVGDRWVIPLLSRVAEATGLPGGGSAKVSLLDVDHLAAQIWQLSRRPHGDSGTIHNAASGHPIALHDVVSRLTETFEPFESAVPAPRLTPHQFEMLSSDNWFTSSLPSSGLPAFRLTPQMRAWYAGALGRRLRTLRHEDARHRQDLGA